MGTRFLGLNGRLGGAGAPRGHKGSARRAAGGRWMAAALCALLVAALALSAGHALQHALHAQAADGAGGSGESRRGALGCGAGFCANGCREDGCAVCAALAGVRGAAWAGAPAVPSAWARRPCAGRAQAAGLRSAPAARTPVSLRVKLTC